jgi:hypothetical protein
MGANAGSRSESLEIDSRDVARIFPPIGRSAFPGPDYRPRHSGNGRPHLTKDTAAQTEAVGDRPGPRQTPDEEENLMEMLIMASHFVRRMCSTDPYAPPSSGLGRLLIAIGITGLVFIGLQSAGAGRAAGFGLGETAFATPASLQ